MRLDESERRALRTALERLEEGNFRRYQDSLWLGFGDLWTAMERCLIRDGFVVRRGDEAGEVTPKGRQLLASLGEVAARVAG